VAAAVLLVVLVCGTGAAALLSQVGLVNLRQIRAMLP
jgi:hypothetical protein